MSNPLERFVSVDERSDGIYISMAPEKKGSIDCETLRNALETDEIVNYDWDRIVDVVSRATGEYERIGPSFKVYDGSFDDYIDVAVSDMCASMKINSDCFEANLKPEVLPVVCCLRRKGIRYGILRKNVAAACSEVTTDEMIEIARGKEPVKGRDAKINVLVKIDPDTRPQSREDGSVDYRSIESFVQVGKGQVLAEKIPPTPGGPGWKVTGEEIPPEPGNDCKLPHGKNTVISENRTRLIAEKSGVLNQYGNLLQVLEILNIENDVDFRVGNIKYPGDIYIQGNVKPGFCVEAGGDVIVKGIVETAQVISRNGKVVVESGVIGKGEAEIFGKAGIQLGFCQEVKSIETDGLLDIVKYCLHSSIVCNVLDVSDRVSSVVGGDICVYDHAMIRQLGNEKNVETRIEVVDKNAKRNKEKLRELDVLGSELQKKKEPLEKQIKSKAAIMKKAQNVLSDKIKAEMKTWVDTYNAINLKLKYVHEQKEKVAATITNPAERKGYIKVTGDIYPGVVISIYGNTKLIKNRSTGKTFRVADEGIEMA
ncbi:MAG: DUF342 domain-containing protein [Chitinivibrionales bacterium]|nr:DUF342 domain-containing protein [Chitinivibrionales bacterium]